MFSQKNDVIVRFVVVFFLCAIMMSGCASAYKSVLPKPPDQYQKIGEAKGEACGSMLIDGTAFNFIPILLNDRVERAYKNALESVPGATALMNVTMQENWFWWVIGSTKCVTITGEAIR